MPRIQTAEDWIRSLGLKQHPEGGYFKETYRSTCEIPASCLGDKFEGARSISTAIYFLLSGTDFSALHRIKSDEVWHHYDGCSLTIHVLMANGIYEAHRLGKDKDEVPQVVVHAGCWFGATVNDPASYALVGCTVAPGFDFRDFELGKREELVRLFPQHRARIEQLTR